MNDYNLNLAIDKLRDVEARLLRHKHYHHEGEHSNDLAIIGIQVQTAIDAIHDIASHRIGTASLT